MEKESIKMDRIAARIPAECKIYIQEMAWKNRTTIAAYLTRIIEADMLKNPDWKDSLDELNVER